MSDVFTASNGATVVAWHKLHSLSSAVKDAGRALSVGHCDATPVYLDEADADALREYFQREKDEELGRWRWPENPRFVVYRDGDDIWVVNEENFEAREFDRQGAADWDRGDDIMADAAAAYFEAHPESKPWRDAKEGEVWVLTGAGGLELPWTRQGSEWISHTPRKLIRRNVDLITAGRRIWPEGDAS